MAYKKLIFINDSEIEIMETNMKLFKHNTEDWFQLLGVLLFRKVTSYQGMLKSEAVDLSKRLSVIYNANKQKIKTENKTVTKRGRDVYPQDRRTRFD